MAIFYVDPTAAAAGSGTLASPFASWAGVDWAAGNTYLQKRGTTYAGVFRVAASGTADLPITIGAYANADGSDDPGQPRPVIVLPGAPATPANGASVAVPGQERDHIVYRDLDIRNTAMPEASDTALVWLGNHCVLDNSKLSSNCGGIYIFGKTDVTVSHCAIDAVGCAPAVSNQAILVAAEANIDNVRLQGNTIVHHGGGTAASHAIRCEPEGGGRSMTNLLIEANRIGPPAGQACSANRNAIGIYTANAVGARIAGNTVSGMLTGIMMSGGERNYVGNNDCSNNMNFGIHVTGTAKFYLIEGNTCNYNGGTVGPNYYGRGIELSSKLGQNAVSGHTIRFNTCNGNYNYGGPGDNGSEGVGIGLDDGTARCSVYGNAMSFNEGNGIQVYGGGDPAKFADTGGHLIMSNKLFTNCRCSVLNRRSGGTASSAFVAHIQLAYTYGTPTVILDNTYDSSTREAVEQGANSANVISLNNIALQPQ